jgi:hypothetical protein
MITKSLAFVFSSMILSLFYLKSYQKEAKLQQTTLTSSLVAQQTKNDQKPVKNAKIQVALLLDTSGSMEGLIEQAKSQLWKMVNKLADAQRQNEDVMLEISLFIYGSPEYGQKTGYVKKVQGMGSDLDGLSEKLFALRTSGGDEYCGYAIQTSLDSLGWTNSPEDLRMVIIAGNEPFNQGPIDFRQSCENASGKDVIVNTIFCGNIEEGRRTHWFDCAQITKGRFLNINTNDRVQHIPTPYDTTIMRINNEMNGTYIGYGKKGALKKSRQVEQDKNAATYGESNLSSRAMSKAKSSYSNVDWDLLDAYAADSTIVVKLEDNDLPDNLKGKSKTEISEEIKLLQKRRTELRKKLIDLEKKMQVFTKEATKTASTTKTLDNVLIEALVEQAKAKGFIFK